MWKHFAKGTRQPPVVGAVGWAGSEDILVNGLNYTSVYTAFTFWKESMIIIVVIIVCVFHNFFPLSMVY